MKNIFVLIFAVVALISCNDKDSKQDWGGKEYYTFEIYGRVADPSDTPIRGISVEALDSRTTTNDDGTYVLKGNGKGVVSTLYVNFTDTDAEENGGRFIGTTKGVVPGYVTGAHGPYLGLFSLRGVNVFMTPNAVIIPPSIDQPIPLP